MCPKITMATEAANTPPAGKTEAPVETVEAQADDAGDPWAQPLPEEEGETPGEAKAEGEEKPTEEAKPEEKPAEKPAELTEEALQAAALKYANKTMAAARRAQRETASVKSENDRLTKAATQAARELDEFKAEFRKNPFSAIKRLNFAGIKEFVDHAIDVGEAKPESADDRVARLEKQIADDKAAQKAQQDAAARETSHAAAKERVQKALEAQPEKYDAVVNTSIGKAAVWEGIQAYAEKYGNVPDAAVYHIAARVEAELATDISRARKFKSAAPASTETPAAKTANAARTSGKTITNASGGGAPTAKEYSLDWDEGRKQIAADMKAEGLL
jgi:hypothetical protein